MEDRVRDHPLGRLDPAEEEHGGVRHHLAFRQPVAVGSRCGDERALRIEAERARDAGAELLERRSGSGIRRLPGRDRRHPGHDRVVPAEHGAGVLLVEPERAHHRRDRERAREASAQLRLARRCDLVDEPLGLVADELVEPRAHLGQPERTGEGIAVPLVLGAVEREHARPDHLPGREARIVDRVGLGVAHHLEREVAPGDEPAVERGQPRDGLRLPQSRQQRMRVALQLLERAPPTGSSRRARCSVRDTA